MEKLGEEGALDAECALGAELLAAEAANAAFAVDFCLAVFDYYCLGGAYVAADAAANTELVLEARARFENELCYFAYKALYCVTVA